MIYLVLAGLVALLAVLVLARTAQQDSRASRDDLATPVSESADRQEFDRSRDPEVDLRQRLTDRDYYLWESRRIARQGLSRAGLLDFFGYLVVIFAVLVVFVSFLALANANADNGLTSDERMFVVLGTLGSVLALILAAAIFFGFGALVRNSSRHLAIAAGTALDSYEPPGQEQ